MQEQPWQQKYGPWALVTGASSGIGSAMARQLARQGLNVLLVARRLQRLEELQDELQGSCGVEVACFACDLSDLQQVDALIERCRSLDIGLLVSNAGFGVHKGEFMAVDCQAQEAMYRANSIAPARLCHALLPALVQRGRGGVLFTGSIEGDAAFPYSSAYAAPKA